MTDSTRRRVLRSATTAAATATLASFAGCAGLFSEDDRASEDDASEDDRTTPEDYSLPEATASAGVEMGPGGTNRYAPEIVHIEVGGTVTWTNVSGNHSATAYAPANDQPRRIPTEDEPWDTDVLVDDGKSDSHTFETPGVYDYYCTPHEPFGMIGTVVVGSPDPEGQSGLTPPDSGRSGKAASKIDDLNAKVQSALED